MSVEALDQTQSFEETAQPVDQVVETSTPETEDAELDAIFDRLEAGDADQAEETGRDERGRFVSKDNGDEVETESPVEGEEGATDEAADPSTPEVSEVPLPSNWTGADEVWKKIPAELRHEIADIENKVHKTLSDQGRQIAAVRPIADAVERHADQFQNVRLADGSTPTADQAVEYLFTMNKQMNTQPVETILQFADTFGVREQVAAQLGVQSDPSQGGNNSALLEKIAGLEQIIRSSQDPARIDQRITERLTLDQQSRENEVIISRFATENPLYAEIPEQDLVKSINRAREDLGDDASAEAVLRSAYDMAVYTNPTLRAKVAAPQVAATPDPKKVENAKRANGVNVTSTSTGKSRQLTEDEELEASWIKMNRN